MKVAWDTDRPKLGEITLRVEQIAAQYGISREALTLTASDDGFFLDQIILRLVRQVAAVPGEQEIRVPKTWRDALKEAEIRRSPIMRWWVARHPIEYRTYRALEVLPNFPELDRYRGEVRLARLLPTYDEDIAHPF